jgi:rhamnosyl/mannosyltransferase
MVRVLHVFKSYAPMYGGLETYLQLLAEGSPEYGFEPSVLVVNDTRRTVTETWNGVPVTRVGQLGAVSSAPLSPWLGTRFRELSAAADLVHLHVPYVPFEVGLHLVRDGKPFVVGYHCDIVKRRILERVYRLYLVAMLKRARLITASTEKYVETSPVLRRFADKCRVIPYGVSLTRFASTPVICEAAARIRSRCGSRPIVLFVGRMRHYKGLDVLLRAMQDVRGAHLLVVGSGAMERRWRRRADAGVIDRVTFLGACPEEVLRAAYRAADVLVLPSTSRAEAFGIVLIEAMTNGVPVISTELGTGTSVVNVDGETGLVVEPGQPRALAAAIDRVVGDEDLRVRMGRAGVRRVRELFSRELMLQRTASLYREALAG